MHGANQELGPWLDSVGLAPCIAAFRAHHVDSMPLLLVLSETDLMEIGLSIGQRRRLALALAPLRTEYKTVPLWEQPKASERRHVTVLFCDLVGSTAMSARLDPDDLRALMQRYFSVCCEVIQGFEGFVARLVGDGILACFGYPHARDDAVESAIRTGLAIVQRFQDEAAASEPPVQVRIGIATGITVISDMAAGDVVEHHAMTGLAPNLAARIQAIAEPGQVLVSGETKRLAGRMFHCADLGSLTLPGLDVPTRVWRVVGEGSAADRFSAYRPAAIAECVGRDHELNALSRHWKLASEAQASITVLSGEPGIGKSRLLRAGVMHLAPRQHVLLQCSPHHAGTPLHPLQSWIRGEAELAGMTPDLQRHRLATWLGAALDDDAVDLVAEVVGLPGTTAGSQEMAPDRRRRETEAALVRMLEHRCGPLPLLLMIEDAHWIDGATEDFLQRLLSHFQRRPFMMVVTTRPTRRIDWSGPLPQHDIDLSPLSTEHARRLLTIASRGQVLHPDVVNLILARADGVPLFIEELTAAVLESGQLQSEDQRLVLAGEPTKWGIPVTLLDSLTARLDRLDGARDVARIASALGREFHYPLLLQVAELPPDVLTAALNTLVEAELLFQHGSLPEGTFQFKHALVQQAAYEGQTRGDRRVLHQRIVHALEQHEPDTVLREPGLMAHHCGEAGLLDREVDYLYAAGRASTRMVAIPQALSYFSRAEQRMSKLAQSPANTRRHIEIILGMMEVGRFAILPARLLELGALAKQLSQRKGVDCDAQVRAAILFQEGRALLYLGRYRESHDLFTTLRVMGQALGSETIERKPASALAMNLCCQGLFSEVLDFVHGDNVHYYRESGSYIDFISCLGWMSYALCQTGPGDEGLRYGHQSVVEAEQIQSPIYVGGAQIWRSHALMAARRYDEAIDDALGCLRVSQVHHIPYLGWHALVFLSLCLCRAGRPTEARQRLEEARRLLAQAANGEWSLLDYLPAIEAELAWSTGDYARAATAASQAIEIARNCAGHFSEAIALRVAAACQLRQGASLQVARGYLDLALQLFEQGGAHAEGAFALLVWAAELHATGHVEAAAESTEQTEQIARRHGFQLGRCEYGAASALHRRDEPPSRVALVSARGP